jgi:hypothetical protein
MPSIFPRYAARVASETNVGDEPEAAYIWFALFDVEPTVLVGWPTALGVTHLHTALGPLGIPVSRESTS